MRQSSHRSGRGLLGLVVTAVLLMAVATSGEASWASAGDTSIVITETIRPGGACASPTGSNNTAVRDGWALPSGGVTYRLNLATVPRDINQAAFQQAIQNAAAVWNATPQVSLADGGSTAARPGRRDGVNTIGFGGATGAIAVAYIWASNGIVQEVDMIFAKGFAWSTNGSINENPTNPNDDCAGAANRMDVFNIAAHEFGHWVGAAHTPADAAYTHRTMYPYASYRELFKRSLSTGDVNSIP